MQLFIWSLMYDWMGFKCLVKFGALFLWSIKKAWNRRRIARTHFIYLDYLFISFLYLIFLIVSLYVLLQQNVLWVTLYVKKVGQYVWGIRLNGMNIFTSVSLFSFIEVRLHDQDVNYWWHMLLLTDGCL